MSREQDDHEWRRPLLEPAGPLGSGGGTAEEEEDALLARKAPDAALVEADAASRRAAVRQMTGMALYALSTIFGSAMSLMAKLAGQRGVGVFEVVFIRSAFLVAFTAPELAWRRVNPFGDPVRRWLYLLRGVLGYLSVSSLYLAITLLPMGDAAVLSFLSPIFVAALSPCILREWPSKGLLLAIPFCMAGVVLVSKPSFIFGRTSAAISAVGVGVGILQAVFNAAARIALRALSIGSSEPMAAILFSMGVVSMVCSAATVAALHVAVLPRGAAVWGILVCNGLSGYLYQVALTAGLQRADAAPAVAMSYLGVIWGFLADVFVFGTPLNTLSVAGAGVITISSFLVAYGERRRQQKAKALMRFVASEARLERGSTTSLTSEDSRADFVLVLPRGWSQEYAEREGHAGSGSGGGSRGGSVHGGGGGGAAALGPEGPSKKEGAGNVVVVAGGQQSGEGEGEEVGTPQAAAEPRPAPAAAEEPGSPPRGEL